MKTKRIVAFPAITTLFIVLECLYLSALIWFLVYILKGSDTKLITIIVLSIILFSGSFLIIYIGIIMGFFDTLEICATHVILRRFAKILRCYYFSKNTKIETKVGFRGATYMEIRFPEYIKDEQVKKGAHIRDGYLVIDHTKARFDLFQNIIQQYNSEE